MKTKGFAMWMALLATALIPGSCIVTAGCAALTQGSSVQSMMLDINKTVIAPAVEKAGEELSTRTAQLSGQASAINPGYRVEGKAGMFNGVVYDLEVRAIGLSANVAGGAQADAGQAGTVPPPALREVDDGPGS